MGLRKSYVGHSSSSLPMPTTYHQPKALGIQVVRSNKPHYQHTPDIDFNKQADYFSDRVSVGSSLSDDMADEEEIIVHLNERALAEIPKPLQNVMREIQAERYERLKKENPNLRVMAADYWIRPVERVHRKTIYNRAPTPLYFALPSSTNKRNERANGASRANPTIQSLGPGHCYRWAAHPAADGDSLHAQQRQKTSNPRYQNHSAQHLHSHPHPTKEFRVISGYRQPVPANLVVNQKLRKHKNARPSGLKSLSVKPVASNLRASLKRSLSRLNKWMKNEI
ncbi:hypothetical protein UA08_04024 [Talaromyces atroroseus]|uniref:Uncharacterized protein n=1 Tax=Talaromyces atroroseus TaxID=1441469 RepID=A0A1Q5Q965_TALAT|nr:hypothetical protein UA08_04024 [Talaromyces atroroseus]OKL60664.1 hypothetical protein UA08_04024 [Talaromyces atroroseus]